MPTIKIYQNRNEATLKSFTGFCERHPELRFWQALVLWAGYWRIEAVPVPGDTKYGRTPVEHHFDTFYWEGRDHHDV